MKVVILKYNAGNIQSVDFALQRLGLKAMVTDSGDQIRQADRVIIPGVGEAGTAMAYMKSRGLDRIIKNLKVPVLGICLGMQLMCTRSEESSTDCLGIFTDPVLKFTGEGKIPHMGWNQIYSVKDGLFKGVDENSYLYFVHSYYLPLSDNTIATCGYMTEFSAAIRKENFMALQFHPEKSGPVGQKILKNFCGEGF